MKRNLLFIVEGKTEGLAGAFGKGLWNILRAECDLMHKRGIRHSPLRKNGKRDLLSDVGFDVRQHLEPSSKERARLEQQGSAPGDFVFVLRDLDCENEDAVRQGILKHIDPEFHDRVEVHFAVQEIEAWMIADPDGFCSVYKHAPRQLAADVARLAPQGQSPEATLDCDPMPSERLADLARKHDLPYRKTIEGPQALGQVNADVVARRCPHFREFRDSLRARIGWQD